MGTDPAQRWEAWGTQIAPPVRPGVVLLWANERKSGSLLCIGCHCLDDGLGGAGDVGEVELGAAALLDTAAHHQLVVAPVHGQHLVEVVSADEGAVGVCVA